MKKAGLIALLTILPLTGIAAKSDSTKTHIFQKHIDEVKRMKEIQYEFPKQKTEPTIHFYDAKLNNKTQYIFPLIKDFEGFTEYFTPKQDWLKNTKQQNIPYIQTGIKIKF